MNARVKNDWGDPPCGGCEDRDEQIAELRAALAPLLDEPLIDDGTAHIQCRVCLKETTCPPWPRPPLHEPDCPVLRKDELLGRSTSYS
jgi:hypothetical protein